ncbi:MarR family winged helix-turn-helix transcriptional regulator [Chitinophaga sp. sic0106]|uniref:MarR family winged helix-turn-helix transcriptional regulator n=1 Tax=Chitinophaga sp. sic0106 TaxID=2854785 RepID=UPI001C43BFCF|nr:MarR family winged helix-turn-helix transcriptional regulator [Chitinophaga sp. sic0106]MBV7530648.1 MarR family winged helix-turn-helix transcriptional regulator [Chitinophaga sp. sic0106]
MKKVIDKFRDFNRYYTRVLGLLDDHLLNSPYSLVEARILYEIHEQGPVSASQIMAEIDMDKGYLSKVLKQFAKDGLISKQLSAEDARVSLISLTAKGLKAYHALDAASHQQIEALISALSKAERRQLVEHMEGIRKLLSGSTKDS